MRENHVTINQFKGMNLTDANHTLDDREFELLENFLVSDTGDLIRRKPLTWFYDHDPNNANTSYGDTYVLGCWFNRLVWYNGFTSRIYVSSVDTRVGGPVSSIAISNTFGAPCGVLYNNSVYIFTNGSPTSIIRLDVSWQSDFNNSSLAITQINATYAIGITQGCSFKDRIWGIFQWNQRASAVAFSDVATPSSWPSTNIFSVSPGDGDYITCIIPFQDKLFIFKRNSTWILIHGSNTNPASWVVRLFDNSIGAAHNHCVLEFGGLLYVLSPRGLYRTDGIVYDYVGYPVQDKFLNHRIGPPTDIQTDGYVWWEGSIFIVRVDDQIFVCSNDPDTGNWFYNPSQNAWALATFGPGWIPPGKPNGVSLLYGVYGRTLDGSRHTWMGTANGVNNAPGHPDRVLWFSKTNPDNTTDIQYVDILGKTFSSDVIPLHFKTKKWDNGGNWYRTKRHLGSVIELILSNPGAGTVDFYVSWNFNEDGVSKTRMYRAHSLYEMGLLAFKLEGMGYTRRLQMEFFAEDHNDFNITGLDMIYLLKREMSESMQ